VRRIFSVRAAAAERITTVAESMNSARCCSPRWLSELTCRNSAIVGNHQQQRVHRRCVAERAIKRKTQSFFTGSRLPLDFGFIAVLIVDSQGIRVS
jgi:hypothetical protein